MKKIIDILQDEIKTAFHQAGYEEKYGVVTLSNRPDLCQYQCNGALSAAKLYKKAPLSIANEVLEICRTSSLFSAIDVIPPGFINMNLSKEFLADFIDDMKNNKKFGLDEAEKQETIVIDYGGPNVAKPLHVGHLRSAVIGESIKRIGRYVGHNVIGDVHLGDWGLQIGLIIIELKRRKPELVYFDDSYEGEYPVEPPFTISDLEEIYPYASGYSKEHLEYKEEAQEATAVLQSGHKGYIALWKHILNVSIEDLKKNYDNLNVHFDLWKKESDAQPFIADMVQYLKENGYAKISEGALVVDIKEESDKKEMPPCIILKSNGASLYETTDIATLIEREELFHPNKVIYVVDKRQSLHFEQVFRCVKKAKLVNENTELIFVGFGTMNGKDGKPFKTRDGGVMRLEHLTQDIADEVYKKMNENRDFEESEARTIAKMVGLASLKYGDLSNQASKDYVFDIERFTSFEGNTGPYVLYTAVRIKSVIEKYRQMGGSMENEKLLPPLTDSETNVMLALSKFNEVIWNAFEENAPHKICQYIYELSNQFNSFYHENKIIAQEDESRKNSWIQLIGLVKGVLTTCVDLLGFDIPERM